MRLAREGIRLRGDFVGAHRVLTASAGMAGEDAVAKAALQELRRAQPNISLDCGTPLIGLWNSQLCAFSSRFPTRKTPARCGGQVREETGIRIP